MFFWSLLFVAWELFWAKWEPSDVADNAGSESAGNGQHTPLAGASGSSLRSATPEVELVSVCTTGKEAAPAATAPPPIADGPTKENADGLRECAENVMETLKVGLDLCY